MDRYTAAGGRVESDLFAEMADRLLDPDKLHDAWRARVEPFVEAFKQAGLAAYIGRDKGFRAPEGFETLPYVYGPDLAEEVREKLAAAKRRFGAAAGALSEEDLTAEDVAAKIFPVLQAKMEVAAAPLKRLAVRAVILAPDAALGVTAEFFGAPVPEDQLPAVDDEQVEDEDEPGPVGGRGRHVADVEVPRADVDVAGPAMSSTRPAPTSPPAA